MQCFYKLISTSNHSFYVLYLFPHSTEFLTIKSMYWYGINQVSKPIFYYKGTTDLYMSQPNPTAKSFLHSLKGDHCQRCPQRWSINAARLERASYQTSTWHLKVAFSKVFIPVFAITQQLGCYKIAEEYIISFQGAILLKMANSLISCVNNKVFVWERL